MLPYYNLMGCKVKDKITKIEGVAISWSIDLPGCIMIALHPGLDKDGKPADSAWYDAKRLEIIDNVPVMKAPDLNINEGQEKGGMQKAAPR